MEIMKQSCSVAKSGPWSVTAEGPWLWPCHSLAYDLVQVSCPFSALVS